jgi:hypothetical protein
MVEMKKRVMKSYESTPFGQADAEFLDVPQVWSITSSALFASDGALWVQRVVKGKPLDWFVFPVGGSPFRVVLPVEFRLTAVRENRLYGYVAPADQSPRVEVYRLQPR